ncbi:MAG TPA: type II secretion system minor pseudopilin GspK [Motiliproteus sp.]
MGASVRQQATPSRQGGVALILVLLVVALMSIVATQLGSLLQLNIQQASNREQYLQAYWFARGGERLARGLIEAALEADNRLHLGQAWASPLLSYPIDGGFMQVRIIDQQACYNLNALSELNTDQDGSTTALPKPVSQLHGLMTALDVDPALIGRWVDPLRDWLDKDNLPTGVDGAEDLYYTNRTPPYLPANGPLHDLTELAFIDGLGLSDTPRSDEEREQLAGVRQQLCVVPAAELKLNVNTLTEEQTALLVGLFEGKITTEDAAEWLEARPEDGFNDVDAFWAQVVANETLAASIDVTTKDQLRVDSEFFLARVEVNYYDANLILYARIKVRDGKPTVYQLHYGRMDG